MARSGAGSSSRPSASPPDGASARPPTRGSSEGSTWPTSRPESAAGSRPGAGRTTPRTWHSKGSPPLAIDGKTARGSRDGDTPGVHLVSAYAPDVKAVLAQLRVDAKTNEHKAALELLGVLPLNDKVVTGDAMFTHRDVCAAVIAGGGDYVLPVKENQPTLSRDIAAAVAEPLAGLSPPRGGAARRRSRAGD